MKLAYNPIGAEPLNSAPSNNDITFDLSDKSIYVKGVKFNGKDSNKILDTKRSGTFFTNYSTRYIKLGTLLGQTDLYEKVILLITRTFYANQSPISYIVTIDNAKRDAGDTIGKISYICVENPSNFVQFYLSPVKNGDANDLVLYADASKLGGNGWGTWSVSVLTDPHLKWKTSISFGVELPENHILASLDGKINESNITSNVAGASASSDSWRHIWFSHANIESQRGYNDDFVYNPATLTLKVANLDGTANKVENDFIIKINSGTTEGTSLYTYNGSVAKTLDIKNGTGIGFTNTAGALTIYNSGVRSIATGTTNGTISVNTNGTSADVAIKGLGTAAYTNSDSYVQLGYIGSFTDVVDLYNKLKPYFGKEYVSITKVKDEEGHWGHLLSKFQNLDLGLYTVGGAALFLASDCFERWYISGKNTAEEPLVLAKYKIYDERNLKVVSSSANGLAPKVINTNTATVGSAYYVLASTNGSATPSWYKLPENAFANDDTKVTQTNTTNDNSYRILFSGNANDTTETTTARKSANLLFNPSTGLLTTTLFETTDITINSSGNSDRFINFKTTQARNWRIGYLGSGAGDANYLVFLSTKAGTFTDDWYDALKFGNETLDAHFAGHVNAPTFRGNLDGTYINKLTGYTKAASASDLVATDTLNTALGKLEYKAGIAYSWYRTITEDDTDEIINKWDEVVDFVNNLEVDLTDEFVTRKTYLVITGSKAFTSEIKIYGGDYGVRLFGSGEYGYLLLGLLQGDEKIHKGKITGYQSANLTSLDIYSNNSVFSGSVTASKFVKSGGTSALFLKADGSVDSNTYATTGSLENYVTLNTSLTISGSKIFTASTNTFSGSDATILTVDRNAPYPAWVRFCKNGTLVGYIGVDDNFKPVFLSGESGAVNKEILHSGNYSSYALPLTGGIIKNGNTVSPLVIKTDDATGEIGIKFSLNGVTKGWLGYGFNYGTYLYTYTGNHRFGIKDDGTAFCDSNIILHSGNYSDYTIKKDGTGATGTWNIDIAGYATALLNTGAPKYANCLEYKNGLIIIGEADGNAYLGSSGNYKLYSFPENSTVVSSGNFANIQNIRLGFNAKYFHDIFLSPNYRYLWHRYVHNNTAYGWARLVEEDCENTSNIWNISIGGSAKSVASDSRLKEGLQYYYATKVVASNDNTGAFVGYKDTDSYISTIRVMSSAAEGALYYTDLMFDVNSDSIWSRRVTKSGTPSLKQIAFTSDFSNYYAVKGLKYLASQDWDWDNITDFGTYKINNGTSISNHPKTTSGVNSYPFGLAMVIRGLVSDGENRIMLLYFPHNTSECDPLYLRMRNNNSWKAWDAIPSREGVNKIVTSHYWANINIKNTADSTTIPTFGGIISNGVLNITGLPGYAEGIRIHHKDGRSSVWFGAKNNSNYDPGMWGITVDSSGMRFRGTSSTTGTSESDYMNIIHGGNVGIGTTNPAYKLDIVGSTRITSSNKYALEISSSENGAVISFCGTQNNEKGQIGMSTSYDGTMYMFNSDAYRTNPNGITGFAIDKDANFMLTRLGNVNIATAKVVVLANGNMGIETNAPTQKLHVNGNVLANKFITSGGSSSLFVKGDGSLDNNTYLTANTYPHIKVYNFSTDSTNWYNKLFSFTYTSAHQTYPLTFSYSVRDSSKRSSHEGFVTIHFTGAIASGITVTGDTVMHNRFLLYCIEDSLDSNGNHTSKYEVYYDGTAYNLGKFWNIIYPTLVYSVLISCALLAELPTSSVREFTSSLGSFGFLNDVINLSDVAKIKYGTHNKTLLGNYPLPNLGSYGIGLFTRPSESTDEGGLIITEDTCMIFNSGDTEWTFLVHNTDLSRKDFSVNNGTTSRVFGVTQDNFAYSLGGFKKSGSDDNYVLLGGGGHKTISDFMLKSDELTNNVTAFTKTLTVTQDWMDTGISGTNLNTGTYIVQVTGGNSSDHLWNCLWSGVLSWFSGNTNDGEYDEIILHRAGHAYQKTIYLRTIQTTNGNGGMKLLIAASSDLTSSGYTFKFKRII